MAGRLRGMVVGRLNIVDSGGEPDQDVEHEGAYR